MERVDKIMKHPLYVENQKRIDELEQNRIFCCHGINHSLDVARILYIMVLEQGLTYAKDVVYGTALLHDIGRGIQYQKQVSHHEAGAILAKEILIDCGYNIEEIDMIVEAIRAHRKEESGDVVSFNALFYMADKLSRNCFDCKAGKECYWEKEKRNLKINY